LKKAVIFVALVSAVFFSNCKNNTEAAPEEQMEQTVTDSTVTVTVTDSIKTDEVTPEVVAKDTLTTPAVK
jgi:PBP1b-binding outer membrane lipoprotein LpoB